MLVWSAYFISLSIRKVSISETKLRPNVHYKGPVLILTYL